MTTSQINDSEKETPGFFERLFSLEKSDKPSKKTKKKREDNRRLDYRYAEDDPFLFIKGNSVWTGVILGTTSDDFATYTEEETTVARNTDMWRALSVHFANHHNEDELTFQLVTRYFPVDVSRWETQYLNHAWNPSQLFIDLVKEKVSPHLAESTPERRQYLLIRLGDFDFPTQVDPLSRVLGTSAGVAEEVFNTRDLDQFRSRARAVHNLMNNMGAAPMDRVDLSWLIRKTLSGHFPVDNTRTVERTRPWRGGFFDEIVNSQIDDNGDSIRIHNPNPSNGAGKYSYTTTVTMNYVDPIVGYNYTQAWGKVLRSMPRPVDVSWRGKIISAEEWARRSKKLVKSFQEEAQNRVDAGAAHSDLFDQKYLLADGLRQQNELKAEPVLVSQQRLTLSAPSPEELTDIVGQLQTAFGDNVTLERTRGAQGFLLEEQLPGDMTPPKVGFSGIGNMIASKLTINKETGGLNDPARWTDLAALSFARLDSSPTVGDEVHYTSNGTALGWRGGPIGYAESNGAAVHFDPVVQMARNSGAGVVIVGSSGGGKSALSLMLFFWCSESGVQCIVLDPKNDFERFVYYLAFGSQVNHEEFDGEAQRGILGTGQSQFQPVNPRFWDETAVIHLGNGADGMLDPWAITDTYDEGENAARQITDLLFTKEEDRRLLDIAFQAMRAKFEDLDTRPALADLAGFLGDERERFQRITEDETSGATAQMEAHDRETKVTRVHESLIRAGSRQYGRLMFGRSESSRPFKIGEHRRVVITLFGLTLPDEGQPIEEWDESIRDGAAAMMTVIRQLNRLFSQSSEEYSQWLGVRGRRPRLLFIDEAYFVTAFKAGRSMLRVFLRQGRSRYFGVVFISQQAKDLNDLEEGGAGEDEASTNQFPTKFVFRQGGLAEAKDAMKLLRPSLMEDPEQLAYMAPQLLKPTDGGRMATGKCVMSDADGRVSMVWVDRMFEELIAASETNPSIRTESQSVDPSPNGKDWTVDSNTRDLLRTGVVHTETGEVREAVQRYEYGEYSALFEAM